MSIMAIPPGEDEDDLERGTSKKSLRYRMAIGMMATAAVSFSLAGTISIGGGESFELGTRSFDVGTCVTSVIEVIPTTAVAESGVVLSGFTVAGINPVVCDGRILRILPFDTSSPPASVPVIDTDDSGSIPDQTFIDIFISGGEFRASSGASVSETSVATLTQSSGSASIRVSAWTSGGTQLDIFSGGQGRPLKSSSNTLEGLSIAFQLRFSPGASISGYGRTDVELRNQ